MRKTAFVPCLPTRATKVPAGREWLHEIKHDGYTPSACPEQGRRAVWRQVTERVAEITS